jgi:cell division protein FtsB
MALLDLLKQHLWKPIVLLLFVSLQYQLWFDDSSIRASIDMEERIVEQQEINSEIDARNQVLSEEIIAIKSGLGSIEAKARKELGMVKEDETYFIVVKPKLEGSR